MIFYFKHQPNKYRYYLFTLGRDKIVNIIQKKITHQNKTNEITIQEEGRAIANPEAEQRQNEQAEIESTKVVQMQTSSRSVWIRIAVVAAILLLLIPTYNYFTFESRVVAKYGMELVDDNIMGSESEINRERFYHGIEAKKSGCFEIAKSDFESILEADINIYLLAQYEIALLEIEQNNTEKAKTTLSGLMNRSENHFIKNKSKTFLNGSKWW